MRIQKSESREPAVEADTAVPSGRSFLDVRLENSPVDRRYHTPAPVERSPRNRIPLLSRCPPAWAERIVWGYEIDSTRNTCHCEKKFNGKLGEFPSISPTDS